MLIYSKDCYFISGLHHLIQYLNIHNAEDFILFDIGHDSFTVVSKIMVMRLLALDPLEAFSCCRQLIISKHSQLDALGESLIKYTTTIIDINKLQTLTPAEIYVMKSLSVTISPKSLSNTLGVSEKTISSHKIKALKKLGMKSAPSFHAEYSNWLSFWYEYEKKQSMLLRPERRQRRQRRRPCEKNNIAQETLQSGTNAPREARPHGVNSNQNLTTIIADENVVPASELAAAVKKMKELQRLLRKKTMAYELLKGAAKFGDKKSG